jgi:homoserine dehydrogenase
LDIKYAEAWGGVIKLIGRVKKLDDGRISAIVSPAFLKKDSQLANVDDVFNGIMVRGDAIGDVVFYGRGAGKLPTASAVVADIIDEAKHLGARKYVYWSPAENGYVCSYQEAPSSFFVRVEAHDKSIVLKTAASLFGKVTEAVCPDSPDNEAAFITPALPEGEFERALASLSTLDIKVISKIRVMDDI